MRFAANDGPFALLAAFAVIFDSMRLALMHSRAKAKTPTDAIKSFINCQRMLLLRLFRIGWRHHLRLTHLENQCARAGLNFSREGSPDMPIWILPDEIVCDPSGTLPQHPLIDRELFESVAEHSPLDGGSVATSLQRLLSEGDPNSPGGVTYSAKDGQPGDESKANLAVYIHMFYPDMWPTLFADLQRFPEPWDLFISIPYFARSRMLEQIAKDKPGVRVIRCLNRGRDVLPFLQLLKSGALDNYEVVCKLHTKRSLHMKDGGVWLAQILDSLLGSSAGISDVVEHFRNTPSLGILGPSSLVIYPDHQLHISRNQRSLDQLIAKLSLPPSAKSRPFFAGTMFWFRPAAFARLARSELGIDDFPLEMAQTDGTTAHAYERMFWPLAQDAGYSVEGVALRSGLDGERKPMFGQEPPTLN